MYSWSCGTALWMIQSWKLMLDKVNIVYKVISVINNCPGETADWNVHKTAIGDSNQEKMKLVYLVMLLCQE